MVLLDMVAKLKTDDTKVVVAHFDHGIRENSIADRLHVEMLAKQYGLPFVFARAELGRGASEDEARRARYDFLKKVKAQSQSDRILTAHHLDDVIETAVHNLLRGTGRKGMSSLKSVDGIMRPLLHLPKSQIVKYARDNQLVWREDETNKDVKYRRNYIRHQILPRLRSQPEVLHKLSYLVKRQAELNALIDNELFIILHQQPKLNQLARSVVISLPHQLSAELIAEWLRLNGVRQFDQKLIEKAVMATKTYKSGKQLKLNANYFLMFEPKLVSINKL